MPSATDSLWVGVGSLRWHALRATIMATAEASKGVAECWFVIGFAPVGVSSV